MTLANKLTLTRLALALVTFACLWTQRPGLYAAALALYVAAVVTDWVDGYVARSTGSVSPFGAIADPVADKVLVLGALIAFVRMPGLDVPTWAVFLIVVRELVIGGVRGLAALHGDVLSASRAGKWTMGIQSAAVLVILTMLVAGHLGLELPAWTARVPAGLVILSMSASLLSGVLYLHDSRSLLQRSWNAPQ